LFLQVAKRTQPEHCDKEDLLRYPSRPPDPTTSGSTPMTYTVIQCSVALSILRLTLSRFASIAHLFSMRCLEKFAEISRATILFCRAVLLLKPYS
ncbi:hypothetical protein L9F63_006814, partial [Diploptera punctata]